MASITPKGYGMAVLKGSAVVVLTPLIATLVQGVEILQTPLIPEALTVGMALGAGVAAIVTELVMDKLGLK